MHFEGWSLYYRAAWFSQRRDVMGDKGGKKDKEKGQKQNAEKQKQKSINKRDKQPKRKP
jgi:hypothetical protein